MIFILFFIFAFLYNILILWYWNGWKNTTIVKIDISKNDLPISIIIPYRNANEALYQSLNYFESKKELEFEVILVNDFSEKIFQTQLNYSFPLKTLSLVDYKINLNNLKNNKKEAIDYGISEAKYPNILCTDSDILPSEHWLEGMMNFTKTFKPKFAAGIHRYINRNSFLNYFLALEQDNYTAISCAGIAQKYPTMCNGANMIFEKTAYIEVGGYEGLFHINGGDDMLLLHRIQAKFPHGTYFIKSLETAVFSDAPQNLYALYLQRKRWLSKSFDYENKWVGIQMLLALIGNILFIFSIILAFNQILFLIFPLWKIMVDAGFLISQKSFFNRETKSSWFLMSLLFYPFYVLWLSFDFFKSKLFYK